MPPRRTSCSGRGNPRRTSLRTGLFRTTSIWRSGSLNIWRREGCLTWKKRHSFFFRLQPLRRCQNNSTLLSSGLAAAPRCSSARTRDLSNELFLGLFRTIRLQNKRFLPHVRLRINWTSFAWALIRGQRVAPLQTPLGGWRVLGLVTILLQMVVLLLFATRVFCTYAKYCVRQFPAFASCVCSGTT